MDLSSRSVVKVKYTEAEDSALSMVEFYTEDGLTKLGDITLERVRLKPFLQTLYHISTLYIPATDTTSQHCKLSLSLQEATGLMRFE
jgi:hypothetical protein